MSEFGDRAKRINELFKEADAKEKAELVYAKINLEKLQQGNKQRRDDDPAKIYQQKYYQRKKKEREEKCLESQ